MRYYKFHHAIVVIRYTSISISKFEQRVQIIAHAHPIIIIQTADKVVQSSTSSSVSYIYFTYICIYHTELTTVSKEYQVELSPESSLIYFIPCDREGSCSVELAASLARLHNEFIEQAWSALKSEGERYVTPLAKNNNYKSAQQNYLDISRPLERL